MKAAIMQPYFMPYIGYFQLMNSVDVFVVYDTIEYTKKGWINRNRILLNNQEDYITIPLKKDSDYLHISERKLSDSWPQDRAKMLNRIQQAYRKAVGFKETFPLVESCIKHDSMNLFAFILNSIHLIKNHLGIPTRLIESSAIHADHTLKSESRVISICQALHATEYINPIGGLELYSETTFADAGLSLKFLKARNIPYDQGNSAFIPFLSVIDVLMYCGKERTMNMLHEYDFIQQDKKA
jgi:hypothetical protein